MKHQIRLHADDIAEIIAEKFDVPPADVDVYAESAMTGYGPTERVTYVVKAKLSIPADRIKIIPKEG